MVSVRLPSDALLQHQLLTWVSLTLDKGYLLTAAPPDLEGGVTSLVPPAPRQPPLLGRGLAPLCCRPDLRHGVAPLRSFPDLGRGVAPPGHRPDLGHGIAPLGRSCADAA